MNIDCGCMWETGAWFPCERHRELSQSDLDGMFGRPAPAGNPDDWVWWTDPRCEELSRRGVAKHYWLCKCSWRRKSEPDEERLERTIASHLARNPSHTPIVYNGRVWCEQCARLPEPSSIRGPNV